MGAPRPEGSRLRLSACLLLSLRCEAEYSPLDYVKKLKPPSLAPQGSMKKPSRNPSVRRRVGGLCKVSPSPVLVKGKLLSTL